MKFFFHIADLIVKDIKGKLNASEKSELDAWVNEDPENAVSYKKAKDAKRQLSKLEVYKLFNVDKAWSAIEDELFKTKTINLFSTRILRYAAAILLPILIIGGASYLFFNQKTTNTLASIDAVIKPGTQKAVLILSNGGTVDLENETSPAQIDENYVNITNIDKQLSYASEKSSEAPKEIIYNELITPRGGSYNLKLADGSEVWLNAGSKLKFPVAFIDSTRQVFLEGEAYFKVAHNGKPFVVNSGNLDVRVLGTSFNISAYADDKEIKTTLVEGKVQIDYANSDNTTNVSRILTPNKQAVISKSDTDIEITEVNTSQYTSWMLGKIEFENEPLNEVMKRLARWYDFKYEFKNNKAQEFHFSARIDNTESISNILEMLEMTTDVKFEVRNNTIVIL